MKAPYSSHAPEDTPLGALSSGQGVWDEDKLDHSNHRSHHVCMHNILHTYTLLLCKKGTGRSLPLLLSAHSQDMLLLY